MKKTIGHYTTAAAKSLKTSSCLICHATDDGDIYVSNGYILYKLTAAEYAAIVQPVTCCEAGRWTIDKTGKHDSDNDLHKLFSDIVRNTANTAPMTPSPLTVQLGKGTCSSYYDTTAFAAFYNALYISALHPAATLQTTGPLSAAVAALDNEPFALVLPVRPDAQISRAVKAYFTANDQPTDEADKLRTELAQTQEEAAALRGDLYRATNEIDELKNKLSELHETKTEQPAEQKPEPKTAAEIIAARFSALDGITATIKGAQTAAPVVWLAGDTKPHAKAIEAAGGKWSGKKNAYYFRVA